MLEVGPHGGCRVLIQLANYLISKSCNVTILTSKVHRDTNYKIDDKVIIKVLFSSVSFKYFRWFLFCFFSSFYIGKGFVIANHFLTVIPSFFSKLHKRNKVLYFIQDIEFEFYKQYRFFGYFLKKICVLTYAFKPIVSANPYLSSRLLEYTNVDFDFNLGVDIDYISNFKEDQKKYDVVYFLRNEVHKGRDRFDDILSKNKDLKFLCISQNKSLLKKYEDIENVSILTPISDGMLFSSVSKSKVLLLTSYHEGFSLPPLEAMCLGVPCILYPCGGPSVYSNKSNSVLISDSDDFSAAFIEVDCKYDYFSTNAIFESRKFNMNTSLNGFYEYLIKKEYI